MKSAWITLLTAGAMITGTSTAAIATPNVSTPSETVCLGANLSYNQRMQMLSDFGVQPNSNNIKIIDVTNEDIVTELGLPTNVPIPSWSKSISSCKVILLPKGSGISVSTNNLTQVTGNMLASALETCGIDNAEIVADAPYAVTGTAALAGILEAFQDATGTKIPEQNKKAANDEIKVTTKLGQDIGQQKAETIINNAKQQVIKNKPTNNIQVENIVNNVVNNYDPNMSTTNKVQIVNLMEKINGLHQNYSNVSKTLGEIDNNIKDGSKDFSNVNKKIIDNVSSEISKLNKEGFFKKIENDVDSFFHHMGEDIENLFHGDSSSTNNTNEVANNSNTPSNDSQNSNGSTNNNGISNNGTTINTNISNNTGNTNVTNTVNNVTNNN